jgi:AraC-like DNA-binding protein/ligand-binding sensor protein
MAAAAGGRAVLPVGLVIWYALDYLDENVNLLSFDELEKLPVIAFYEQSFRKATGVPLKVVAPGVPGHRLGIGLAENSFCHLIAESPAGCEACHEAQMRALGVAAQRRAPFQIACFAGLTDVAVPIIVGELHVATMLSGQVLRREPTERDFTMIVAMVGKEDDAAWRRDARQAYFATTVVTPDRLQAIVEMLGLFADYIGEYATRQAIARAPVEPPAVLKAKDYVEAHLAEHMSLAQVVQHVGVSRFYFCKLFKKATGMTLTEYVSRVRLEKAKAMLVDPNHRISEVAYAAGFGSIPQFNSVFRRYVGVAPTEYRDSLRRDFPASSALTG